MGWTLPPPWRSEHFGAAQGSQSVMHFEQSVNI